MNEGFLQGDGGESLPLEGELVGLPLESLSLQALRGIPLHLKTPGTDGGPEQLSLYAGSSQDMTEEHRVRLIESGVKFIYVDPNDASLYLQQREELLEEVMADTSMTPTMRASLLYLTAMHVMEQVLASRDVPAQYPRLQRLASGVATLVASADGAFPEMLSVAPHDDRTATHLVNTGAWITSLAHAMGTTDPKELRRACLVGLLHDVGKTALPANLLAKPATLDETQWTTMRRHPDVGARMLERAPAVDPLVILAVRQHHERLDGTGYPIGLTGDAITELGRMCAVVDSFEAMTSKRPFRSRVLGAGEALERLMARDKYDRRIVAGWARLLGKAHEAGKAHVGAEKVDAAQRERQHERSRIRCMARVFHLQSVTGAEQGPAHSVYIADISRSGLGLSSRIPIPVGEKVRIYLQAPGWAERPLDGVIVVCRQAADGTYHIGVSLGAEEEGQERNKAQRAQHRRARGRAA